MCHSVFRPCHPITAPLRTGYCVKCHLSLTYFNQNCKSTFSSYFSKTSCKGLQEYLQTLLVLYLSPSCPTHTTLVLSHTMVIMRSPANAQVLCAGILKDQLEPVLCTESLSCGKVKDIVFCETYSVCTEVKLSEICELKENTCFRISNCINSLSTFSCEFLLCHHLQCVGVPIGKQRLQTYDFRNTYKHRSS